MSLIPAHQEIQPKLNEENLDLGFFPAPTEQPAQRRVIAICVDGNEKAAVTVAHWCLENVIRGQTDTVVLLHARQFLGPQIHVQPGYPGIYRATNSFTMDPVIAEKVETASKTAAHDLLALIAKTLLKSNVHRVEAVCLVGETRQQLEMKLNELKPNLIVCGSRGLSAVTGVLVGSVSTHLLHHLSGTPILVCPPSFAGATAAATSS